MARLAPVNLYIIVGQAVVRQAALPAPSKEELQENGDHQDGKVELIPVISQATLGAARWVIRQH